MHLVLLCLLFPFLLITNTLRAQDLPPPGGWPLRSVAAVRAVPEPPGGLVPYRQGQLWGFADTTGRVWIRPVFAVEPARFGAGLLLQSQQLAPREYRRRQPRRLVMGRGPKRRREPKEPRQRPPRRSQPEPYLLSSNVRFGQLLADARGGLSWVLLAQKPPKAGRTWLLNAHGEQLTVRADEAIGQAADGHWEATARRGQALTQPELVAIEPHELESEAVRPGRLFTVPLGRRAPASPPRLTRRRSYDLDADFAGAFAGSTPLYLAQKVNWLRPTRQVVRNGRCGDRFADTDTRYRHRGQSALFDAQGHRLTRYAYGGMKRLQPNRLAYWHWTDDQYDDEYAADTSGLPQRWEITENINGPARRYGLLDRQGHEITPALYAHLEVAGPNSLWVVAVREGRLNYGLIDTLGRDLLPLSPRPLSLPDAAGLLRRFGTAPRIAIENPATYSREPQYPDTATVQYLRASGRPAFAGHYTQAGAFWQGRALVKSGADYGIIDTLGRWVLSPQPAPLRYYAFDAAHHEQQENVDPLGLFHPFNSPRGRPYWGTRTGDPSLLLAHGPTGYGLRDGQTGQLLVPALFDERPEQWYGGVVGKHQGQPLGYTYRGQSFAPAMPASFPPGVRKPALTDSEYHPLLQRAEQGWRTRGGRQLWQD